MALTPEEARELQNMLLEIEKLSERLKKNIDTTSLQDLEKSAGAIKQLFKSLSKEWEGMTDDISYAAVGFRKIVQEISNVNVGLRDSNKAYNNLTSIASKLQSHQQGIGELSSKEIKNLKEKAKIEKQRLENAQDLLKEKKLEYERNKSINEASIKAKQEEIALIERKAGKTKQDYLTLRELRNEVKGLNKDYATANSLLDKTTAALNQNKAILSNQDELYKGLLSAIDDETRKAKNLEKALGLGGAAVKGIGDAFKKAGLGSLVDQMGLDEAQEKMKRVAFRITQGGTNAAGLIGKFRILGAGIGSLGKSIMKNLTDPLVLAGLAAKAVSAGIGLIKKGVGLLSKGFGSVVGFVKNLWGMADQFAAVFEKYAKAGQFAAQNFSAIGAQVGKITAGLNAAAAADPFMRVAEAGPAFKALVDGTGIMQTQMTKSVKEAHDFSYWMGYSAEETGQLYKLSQLNGQTMTDTAAEVRGIGTLLNKQHKTSLDLRKVEQTALKASAAVKFNLSQNPKAIAEAAFYATKLSMTLDEIAAASEQTLNFEQSIQDQLAYQTMSGKELNIDAYQQAALRGDSATAAKELNKLIEEHGSELKGNVLLQDQFAKSIGIGKDKLLEAMTAQELANTMGEDRVDIEKGLQFYMSKGLTREEAANKLAKEGLATQLAQSKRAEAMSRALEDFRDYMATKLWPIFKAVFSPANIKVFMAVINGMRPVFAELGKAITAFFPTKSANSLADTLKTSIMPTVLELAKSVTKISGIFGGTLFNILDGKIKPLIQDKIVPLTEKIGKLFEEFAPEIGSAVESVSGGIIDTISDAVDLIMENKDEIKKFFSDAYDKVKLIFSFVEKNAAEIATTVGVLAGINLLKTTGVLDVANTMLKAVGQVTGITPGGRRNPFYVHVVSGGGMMSGPGMDMPGRRPSSPETNYQKYSRRAGNAMVGLGAAFGLYTMGQAFFGKGEKDVTQEEIDAYRSQQPSMYSEEISALEAKGAGRTEEDDKRLAELIAKSNKEAIDEIISSQYQTGSKTGDITLGLTETVGSSMAYSRAPQMSTDEVLKKVAEMKAADPTKTTAQALDEIRQAEKSFLTKIGDKASELWGNAKTWLSETLTKIGTKASELFSSAKTFLSETVNKIGEKSKQLLDDIGRGISNLAAKAEELASRAAGFISDMVGAAKEKVSNLASAAKDKILNLASSAKTMVTNAIDALKNSSVGKTVSTAYDKGKNLVSGVVDKGKNLVSGVVDKGKSLASSAVSTVQNVVSNPQSAASSAWSWVKNTVSDVVGAVKNSSVGQAVGGAIDKGKNLAASAGSAISETAGSAWKWTKSSVLDPFKNAFKVVGKFLGPIMTAVSSVTSVMGTIDEAKYQMSMGQAVDFGALGKKIIQAGAYPIANASLNFLQPGIGSVLSLVDAGLDMLGVSPVRFISDNLIDLIPDDVFAGLGKQALGNAQPVAQIQDGGIDPNGGLIVSKPKGGIVAQVDPQDNIFATTNKLSSGGGGGGQNNAAIIAALDRLTNMIANSNKTVELNIDGKKVGYAVTPTVLDTAKKTSINV